MSNFNNFSNQPHRYSLEKGSKKHLCPDCGKKRFVRFVDTTTGEYLPEHYGRCDKGDGHYFVNPYSDGYAKMICEQEQKVTGVTKVTVPKQKYFRTQPEPQLPQEPVFFDLETFNKTLQLERYGKNTFIQNLLHNVQFPFEVDEVKKVIELYQLGTVVKGYKEGAVTFPFIDIHGNVRAIQAKQFDKQNHSIGKPIPLNRIIENYHIRKAKQLPKWIEAYNKNQSTFSCLFGEHLLSKYHSNPVALIEAPKTAIYCWLYFSKSNIPIYKDCIWLATGAKGYLNFEKASVLKGRFVYVLPDLSKDGSTFKEWEAKAKDYESCLPGTRFIMDDILEKYGTEQQRENGADIADVLIFDWRKIRESQQTQPEIINVKEVAKIIQPKNTLLHHVEQLPKVQVYHKNTVQYGEEKATNWSEDIAELEMFFANIELPKECTKLHKSSTITDISLFLESHFALIKNNVGNRTYLPYLQRLQELKQVLSKGGKAQ
jgi:hypothetical protein